MIGKKPIARFRNCGVQIAFGVTGWLVFGTGGIIWALQGKDNTLLFGSGALAGGLLLAALANRQWLIFLDNRIVRTRWFDEISVNYADISKVSGQNSGLVIYAGEKKLRLYYGSFLTWSAWPRVANLLAQMAPSAEFDAAAQRMRDGDIGEARGFITLGWVAIALIVGVVALITLK